MTAGFAMKDKAWIFTAIYEWRGHVASAGGIKKFIVICIFLGDPHAVTIPNFIKLLSHEHINGASVGKEVNKHNQITTGLVTMGCH